MPAPFSCVLIGLTLGRPAKEAIVAVSLKVQMPCPENITLQQSRPSGSYIHSFNLLLGD